MHRTTAVSLVALMSLVGASHAVAQPAPALPTQEEVQADFDAGKYADALKKVSRLLALKGDAAAAYDRATLLKLKGESLLRSTPPQTASASDTFKVLAREAKDEKEQATYTATSLLITRSKLNKYLPKSSDAKAGAKTPIDILEAETRKTALAALYADETPATVAKVDAAKKAGTLPRIVEVTRPIADLRMLELASSGADATTGAMLAELSKTANELMTNELKAMKSNVADISERANKTEAVERPRTDGSHYTTYKRKGLNSEDKAALNDVMSTCQKIAQATDELAGALKAQASAFASVKAEAEAVAKTANKVLNDDYGTVDREDVPGRRR